jgi:polyisoprenoid-binding protein YceI
MKRNLRAAVLATVLTTFPALLATQSKPITPAATIDVAHSTLTVQVYRSGVFSFAGDNHEIRAPIASGSIDERRKSVEFSVGPNQMRVLDPGLDAKKRAQVQEAMLGPEVLDPQRYREIRFRSTSIEPSGQNEWAVQGNLTLHGETRPIALRVSRLQGQYRGSAVLKQTDFGIKPIRVGGGTVKVKNEVKVEFAIVTDSR